jgi:uroporphyrinogen-III synthase
MTKILKILSTKKIKENLKKNYDFQIFDYDFLKISFCLDEKKLEKIFENKKNIFIFTSSYAVKAVLNFLENNEKKYDLKAFAIE